MKRQFSLFVFCLGLVALHAQGWERFFPELTYPDLAYGIVPTPDGGVLLTADNKFWTGDPHLLLKIAPDGVSQWQAQQADFFSGIRPAMLPVGVDHLLLVATNATTGNLDLTETDANLQVVWTQSIAGANLSNYSPPQLKATPDGYLIAYQTGAEFSPVRVIKISLSGQLLWQQTYDFAALGAEIGLFSSLASDSQGNFFLSGAQDFTYIPVLAKFSPTGSLLFIQTYPQSNLLYGFLSLAVLQDSLVAAVTFDNTAILNAQNGLVLNTIPMLAAGAARTMPDDKLLLLTSSDLSNLLLRKLEWDGTVIWQHTFDRLENLDLMRDYLWPLADGGVVGLAKGFTGQGYTPFVFRTDANGNTFTNRIQGNIFTDLDADCTADTTAANRIVIAEKTGNPAAYATTDQQGNYGFLLDTGTYLVHVLPPNDLWNLCEDSVLLTLAFDTLQWNTGITSTSTCAWPTVDLSAAFLRRCFPNTYHVNYGNEGTQTADSAIVTLFLDPFLSLQSASLPYIALGDNIFAFQVGDIGPLQTGSFSVEVLLSCDAELGQTHCSSAQIEIANPCPFALEDLSVIDVTAACEGDSVAFTIKNIGGAPMTSPAEFVVIEDLIVMRQGEFQLPAQQSTIIKCPADGKTARIYAGQAPGEPPFFAATTAIEGCNGPIQPGFWQMFPEVLASQAFDRDCQANIGAFDPNDKQAIPTGYDAEHWLARNVPLDYKIRFQNTGTDTAFTVVIRDTLSAFLNASSLRPGASSHPYTWQLLGNGVLEFRFDNILLPDSNVNLSGSNGFVQFHIDQQPELPLETLIENRAAIFFDFNAPVITNTTFHRIGMDFLPSVATWEPAQPGVLLRLAPNPVGRSVRLTLPGWTGEGDLQLQLFDLQGHLVREIAGDATGFAWQNDDLAAGLYLFAIRQGGVLVGRGKLVAQ